MNKTKIIGILEETAAILDSIICSTSSFLSAYGKEYLNFRMHRGRPEFYRRSEEGKRTYVSLTAGSDIEELSSVYYNKRLLSAALKEKRQIERCLDILKQNPGASDIDKVAERIPEEVKANAVISQQTGEGYARIWQEGNGLVKKRRTHRKDDYHRYKTIRGDYVGSKSEVIIADRLFTRGIPYHYEVAFTPEVEIDESRPVYDDFGMVIGFETLGFSPQDSDTLHPDFYVLNKRTSEAFFWEHFGKMDDPEYCRKNFNRFMRIVDAGFIIGKDLLVTHEDSKHPLQPEAIDRIIDKYFI